MEKVGVYLASEPFGGGTYQYNLSIIHALDSFDQSKYKITVFCHSEKWADIAPKRFEKIIVARPLILRILGRVYKMIDRSAEGRRRFAWFFNPIIKEINKSYCEIIIYPSQDALSYQTNKKSLSTIHDLMHRYESHFEEYQNGEYDRREKHYSMMCKYATGILVDSSIGKQHVVECYSTDKSKVFVLPFVPPMYFLNAQDIDVKLKYGLPENYLFYAAQFWEHKNHINLLKALRIVLDRGVDINLVLVGSKKNNYEKVMNYITELGLGNYVFVLGYVSNDDMVSLQKNAVATTFVSLIGPTNIPPMEALTLSSPLICSNAYGMPEQVGDGALLVNPKSYKDIAEKIERLVLDKSLQEELKNKGRQVIFNYSQKEFNNILEKTITLISRK